MPSVMTPQRRQQTHRTRRQLGVVVPLLVCFPLLGRAAEGGLEIVPTGFAEAWGEHGLLALLPQHIPQFWMLVLLFAVLSVLLNRFAFTPLLNVIDERERRIGGARERAVALAEQSESLLARHDESLREVRDRAQTERQGVLEQARESAQGRVDTARRAAEELTLNARRDVEVALVDAQGSLRVDAEEVAETIAERLLGRNPNGPTGAS